MRLVECSAIRARTKRRYASGATRLSLQVPIRACQAQGNRRTQLRRCQAVARPSLCTHARAVQSAGAVFATRRDAEHEEDRTTAGADSYAFSGLRIVQRCPKHAVRLPCNLVGTAPALLSPAAAIICSRLVETRVSRSKSTNTGGTVGRVYCAQVMNIHARPFNSKQ